MNFDLDEDQVMLGDLVARFMADRYDLPKRARYRKEPEGFSRDNWRALGDLGLLALPFGEAEGGMGGGAIELMVALEGFGRGLCAEPYLSDLMLAGRLLAQAGTVAQRAAWLPAIIAGEKRLALAHVETAARYNLAYVACTVDDGPLGPRLTGVKTFVQAGLGVDGYLVSARTAGAVDDPEGVSLWLVPADAPGLIARPYRLIDGSVACELRLQSVAGAERLDGGWDALLAAFDAARLAACAEMVGIMSTLLDSTLEHLRTRRQFGQPIGSFQFRGRDQAWGGVHPAPRRDGRHRRTGDRPWTQAHPAAVVPPGRQRERTRPVSGFDRLSRGASGVQADIAELGGLEDGLAAVDRVELQRGVVDVESHRGAASAQDGPDFPWRPNSGTPPRAWRGATRRAAAGPGT